MTNAFDLTGRVAIITGGAGFLGRQHAEALATAGANCVLADLDGDRAAQGAQELSRGHGERPMLGLKVDVTRPDDVSRLLSETLDTLGKVDILINNAAIDPKVDETASVAESWHVENLPLEEWDHQLNVGLTGAFLCCQVIGSHMTSQGGGVILNIASDLSVIAPDQRIYRKPDTEEAQQPVKPVTYSVVKTGLIGLTRYLATYWAGKNVRVNAISPGGVYNGQPQEFVDRLADLIPMGRMAVPGEYQAAVVFLVSDASSYMTGQNLVMDGGRTVW